jgi:hypothetical protein
MRGDPAFWATFSLQLVTKLQTTVANDDFDWYVSSLLKGVKIGVPSIVVVSTVLTTVFLYRSTSEFGTKYPRRHVELDYRWTRTPCR